MPHINKNLASGILLEKSRIKFVFESGKLVLTQNEYFVCKGYSSDGMVKLCNIEDDSSNNDKTFAYMIDLFTLWYGRLAHIGITMKRIIKYGLISCKLYNLYKSKTCIKSKIIKKSFHSVEITSQLIELV